MSKSISICKGCGTEIVWLKTQKGNNIPIDADTVVEDEEIFDPDTMTTHFETCPMAGQFRKKRSK